MKRRLLKDIFSKVTRKLYGARGEVVTVIADHDSVLIVEGKSGRFPVLKQETEPIPE